MRIPAAQIARIELAEFEASDDEAECAVAIVALLDIVGPPLDRYA